MFKIQQCKNKSIVHSYYLFATWKHLTVVEESKETFNLYPEHLAPIQEFIVFQFVSAFLTEYA